jgi:2-polyprenyl-3-methyl-5-hydroxy-6-metoxy-1,4-benzoquinol methylase
VNIFSSLKDFWEIGREKSLGSYHPLIRAGFYACGDFDLHLRVRTAHMLNIIRRLDLPQDACILDAGCGRGTLLFQLAKAYPCHQLFGIEVDEVLVKEGRQIAQKLNAGNIRFSLGNLCEVADWGGPFHIIIAVDVLEHILNDVAVLSNMRSALRKDGKLILHLPLRHQQQKRIIPTFRTHMVDNHVRDEYTLDNILNKLAQANLKLENLHYSFGWAGELSFELNNLFWQNKILRIFGALLTYPIACLLAFYDTQQCLKKGNSFIVLASANQPKAM